MIGVDLGSGGGDVATHPDVTPIASRSRDCSGTSSTWSGFSCFRSFTSSEHESSRRFEEHQDIHRLLSGPYRGDDPDGGRVEGSPADDFDVLVALIIASVKASLSVAGWLMHLASEQKMIYAYLGFTAFFFLVMGLTLWAMHDAPTHAMP